MAVLYDRVALIGLGLIAGSMSLAMRAGGLAGETVGYARSPETRAAARQIGLVDQFGGLPDAMAAAPTGSAASWAGAAAFSEASPGAAMGPGGIPLMA